MYVSEYVSECVYVYEACLQKLEWCQLLNMCSFDHGMPTPWDLHVTKVKLSWEHATPAATFLDLSLICIYW